MGTTDKYPHLISTTTKRLICIYFKTWKIVIKVKNIDLTSAASNLTVNNACLTRMVESWMMSSKDFSRETHNCLKACLKCNERKLVLWLLWLISDWKPLWARHIFYSLVILPLAALIFGHFIYYVTIFEREY